MTPAGVKRDREEPFDVIYNQKRPKMDLASQSLEKIKAAFEAAIQRQDISTLERLLQSSQEFFKKYRNPARADEIRELARGVLSPPIASALNDYADQVQLPTALLRRIVTQFVEAQAPEEASGLRQTSRAVRKMAVEAHDTWLKSLHIESADQTLAFAHEFGTGLTFLNLEYLTFSEGQLERLLQELPILNTLHLELEPGCAVKLAEAPTARQLRTLHLKTDEDVAILANSQTLKYLDSLTIQGINQPIEDSSAQAIVHSQNFANLQHLDLSDNLIDDNCAIAIARSPLLTNLRTLDLSQNIIGDEGAAAIASSITLTKLQRLWLGHSVGDKGAIALARSQTLTNLRSLSLASIGNRGVIALATSQAWRNLQDLHLVCETDFGETKIDDEGVKAFAQLHTFTHLRSLTINDTSMGDVGAKALALSSSLGNLKILNVTRNDIEISGLVALVNSPIFKLEELYCSSNRIEEEGFVPFIQSQQLQHLQILDLSWNEIGDAGATALALSPYLQNLQILDLSLTGIGDLGAIALARSTTLRTVRSLYLGSNDIGDAGATAFAESLQLRNIQILNLNRNKIGDKGAIALAQSQQLKRLQFLNVGSFRLDLAESMSVLAHRALDLSCNEAIGSAGVTAFQYRRQIMALSQAKKEELYREISRFQGLDSAVEWGKAHLYDNPEILNQSLKRIQS